MESGEGAKMWGGCFSGATAPTLAKLNRSLDVDKRMYREDIFGSRVYAGALLKAGVLTEEQHRAVSEGLEAVLAEWESGEIVLGEEDEDVHGVNERRLRELIGETGERLHAGRSRNDQVATDLRLWLVGNAPRLRARLRDLVASFVALAGRHPDVLMPGYTHLRRAHPVRFAHFALSHCWNLKSDDELLESTVERARVSPLGSGALAGNPFPVDRRAMAADLGLPRVTMNSMSAVADRDFVAEFLFWCSLCGTHLSRLAEDLILYSTDEFGFVSVAQEFSTGSSLLPQKRNPDGLELTRGSAGRLIGNATGFLATLKSLPSTYNKDLQDDKRTLFESFDLIDDALALTSGTVRSLTVNAERCRAALRPDQLAVRLANRLVERGVPFRAAHRTVGRVVTLAESEGVPIDRLSERQLVSVSEHLAGDLSSVWDFEAAVEEHRATGGTSLRSVREQTELLDEWLRG